MLNVICIDGSKGEISGKMPPFKEGDICSATQCPVYSDCYDINGNTEHSWSKRRFIPLSIIDETELLEQRQTQYA